jgi:hypothetical protein
VTTTTTTTTTTSMSTSKTTSSNTTNMTNTTELIPVPSPSPFSVPMNPPVPSPSPVYQATWHNISMPGIGNLSIPFPNFHIGFNFSGWHGNWTIGNMTGGHGVNWSGIGNWSGESGSPSPPTVYPSPTPSISPTPSPTMPFDRPFSVQDAHADPENTFF